MEGHVEEELLILPYIQILETTEILSAQVSKL